MEETDVEFSSPSSAVHTMRARLLVNSHTWTIFSLSPKPQIQNLESQQTLGEK